MNEQSLFEAIQVLPMELRADRVEEICRTHPELRPKLEQLLAVVPSIDDKPAAESVSDKENQSEYTGNIYSASVPMLMQPEGMAATAAYELNPTYPETSLVGIIIASKYKLLEEIGNGGMGTVYVAEQTAPVKRKVAVKLIKPGMDSKNVLARFEAERQALALMDHPNIARVLDAGLTEQRRPYFVMEYIKGLPLTKYCDDAKLSIDERLKLFIQICQALQHAHQKGIIHRDLKPGNILIALYDGKPVPKVIDFGLAKALHQPLTEHTLHTAHAMVLGTPLYMSPEQAELNNLDIDTRTDIYSLGVILYELLTGVTPLGQKRFKEAAWNEVIRIIKEEEPSKPSTKLTHSANLASVAAQRQMDPKKLPMFLKGDLDLIVMKSLSKERERRYETANGFAADVQRYLGGEVVQAHPPSLSYRMNKFIRRYRKQVIAAGLVLVALVAGIAGTTWQSFRAMDAEGRARENELAEKTARANTEKALTQAQEGRVAAQKSRDELSRVLARQFNENAQRMLESDDASMALFWTAESLKHSVPGSVFDQHNRILWADLKGRLPRRVPIVTEETFHSRCFIAKHSRYYREGLRLVTADYGKEDIIIRFIDPANGREQKPGIRFPIRVGEDSNLIRFDPEYDRFFVMANRPDGYISKCQAWGWDGKPIHDAWKCNLRLDYNGSMTVKPTELTFCAQMNGEGSVGIYRITDGKLICKLAHDSKENAFPIMWLANGSAILVNQKWIENDYYATEYAVFDCTNGERIGPVLTGVEGHSIDAVTSQTSKKIWVAAEYRSKSDEVTLWIHEMRSGSRQKVALDVGQNHTAFCLSPDAKSLIFHQEGQLHEYDLEKGAIVHSWKTENLKQANRLAFSPLGKRLSIESFGITEIWDWKSRRKCSEPRVNERANCEFSSTDDIICPMTNYDIILDSATGHPLTPKIVNSRLEYRPRFSPDSRYLFGKHLWDVVQATHHSVHSDLEGPRNLAFATTSPSEDRLLGTGDQHVWIWDCRSQKLLLRLRHDSANFAQLDKSKNRLISASNFYFSRTYPTQQRVRPPDFPTTPRLNDSRVVLWDLRLKKEIATLINAPSAAIFSASFSPDDRWVAIVLEIGGANGQTSAFHIRLYDAETGTFVSERKMDEWPVIGFHPTQPLLLAWERYKVHQFTVPKLETISIAEIDEGSWFVKSQCRVDIPEAFIAGGSCFAFPPSRANKKWQIEGTLIHDRLGHNQHILANHGQELRIYNIHTGEALSAVMKLPQEAVVDHVCYAHRKNWFAIALKEKLTCYIQLWNIETGSLLQLPLKLNNADVQALWFSEQDDVLYAINKDAQFYSWPIRSTQTSKEEIQQQTAWHTLLRIDPFGVVVNNDKTTPAPVTPVDQVAVNQWHQKSADRLEDMDNKEAVREHVEEYRPRDNVFSDYIWLGRKRFFLEEYDAAIAAFDRAIQLAPMQANAWGAKGFIRANYQLLNKNEKLDAQLIERNLSQGLSYILKSLELNPQFDGSSDEVKYPLWLALYIPSRAVAIQKLASQICDVMSQFDQDHEIHLLIALARFRHGKYAEALQSLNASDNAIPEDAKLSHEAVASMLVNPWNFASITIRNSLPVNHLIRAMCYAKLNKLEQARQWLRLAQFTIHGQSETDTTHFTRLLEEAMAIIGK